MGTAHALQQAEPLLAGRTGTVVLLSGDVPLLRALDTPAAARSASRRQGGRDGGDRHCGAAVRLRPDHQNCRPDCSNCGGTRCVSGRETNTRNQQRYLCLRSGTAFRRLASHCSGQCTRRVLPHRSHSDLPASQTPHWKPRRRGPGGGPRREQPYRTCRIECRDETEKERGTDGGGRYPDRSSHHLHRSGRRVSGPTQ